ncbi:MAG: DUF1365 domain-containing protein [Gammaproteobacteria bacterium]|nr:MAG: DUF1365 domain-containing protein [Gammaproteobacteria bacterium]
MNSCLYEGRVRHRRFSPRSHRFEYRMFYVFLDLDELDIAFEKQWFWSTGYPALAWFRQADHFGSKSASLKKTIMDVVEQHTGKRPQGPIRVLTHLRYFGYVFNPVSFFYCYDKNSTQVETIVAEVNNTPWGERHIYVLPQEQDVSNKRHHEYWLKKEFHVSPFMPMDIQYEWIFTDPEKNLTVHMENYRQQKKIFDATLTLHRKDITSMHCASVLLRYPFVTLTVIVAIYWQAMKLFLKGIPFYTHPDKLNTERGADTAKIL